MIHVIRGSIHDSLDHWELGINGADRAKAYRKSLRWSLHYSLWKARLRTPQWILTMRHWKWLLDCKIRKLLTPKKDPNIYLNLDGLKNLKLTQIAVGLGLVPSRSRARKMLKEGGIRIGYANPFYYKYMPKKYCKKITEDLHGSELSIYATIWAGANKFVILPKPLQGFSKFKDQLQDLYFDIKWFIKYKSSRRNYLDSI